VLHLNALGDSFEAINVKRYLLLFIHIGTTAMGTGGDWSPNFWHLQKCSIVDFVAYAVIKKWFMNVHELQQCTWIIKSSF